MSQHIRPSDVVSVIASQARRDPRTVLADMDLRDQLGLRSLDVLVLCETLERTFQVSISDEEVAKLTTVGAFTDLVVTRGVRGDGHDLEKASARRGPPGSELRDDGTLQTDIEISMQLLGMNGLAETPLLMRVADLRWQHMAAVAGVLTRDIVDDVGDRLYAAVFFVETCFPPARPMGTFRENDKISVVSTLARFGGSILDGHHYVFPLEAPAADKRAPANAAEASAREVPWLRISNSFVKKWEGAGWLKKSRPVSAGFERIREVAEPPSSHEESAAVRERGHFFDIPASYVPLTAEPVVVPYDIVPDRDMNGAGLLYFAMYPAIMDVAERRALGEASALSLSPDLVDKRTLVHRKTAYFSNAPANDRVRATLRIHVENPFRLGVNAKELSPIRLIEEIQLHRESDGRLMAISGAKKTILGVPIGETSLFSALERLA